MPNKPGAEKIRKAGSGFPFRWWLAALALVVTSPSAWGMPSTEADFLKSYGRALDLLSYKGSGGQPLLESSYDSLYLFETCVQTELSREGQRQAAHLLNQKLSSPSFAVSYKAYRRVQKRLLSQAEAKVACQALARKD